MPVRVRLWARVLRKLRRFLVGGILTVGLLWMAILGGLQLFLTTEWGQALARRGVVALLTKVLDTDVELRKIRLSGIAHISLEGFTLYDKGCEPFFHAEEIRLAWYPSAFWRGFWKGQLRLPVSDITLYAPQVYIYTEKGSGLTNVDRLFPSSDTTRKPSPWELSISTLELRNGRFRWIDSTAEARGLMPRRGFLQYAHLSIDSINLRASIEWKGEGYLFLLLEHLSLHEQHSDMRISQMELVMQAYPDSIIVPYLHIRLPQTDLKASVRFPKEGLDKLFSDTETKLFTGHLVGQLEWGEVAAFAGDSLPIRGVWEVETQVKGDLYRIRAEELRIGFASGAYVVGKGEIVHYARPQKMKWTCIIQEASFALEDVQKILPDIGELPPEIRTDYRWRVRGTHVGRIGDYGAELATEGMQVALRMQYDTTWRYDLQLACKEWKVSAILTESLIHTLSGALKLKGRGFTLSTLWADVEAALTAMDFQQRSWQLHTICHVEHQTAQGTFSTQTPFGMLDYTGKLPLATEIAYQGSGRFSNIATAEWGSVGYLSGRFEVEGVGIPWEYGAAYLTIADLRWQKPDTLYFMGDISLQAAQGTTYAVQGSGLKLMYTVQGAWYKYLPLWVKKWLRADTTSIDTLYGSWRVEGQLQIREPLWGELMGVPSDWVLKDCRLFLHLQADSSAPYGSLHFIVDTLKWKDAYFWSPYITLMVKGDAVQADFGSVRGRSYLAYEGLHGELQGTWRTGQGYLEAFLSERRDTVQLRFNWVYNTQGVSLRVDTMASYLTLGGYRWRFAEAMPFTMDFGEGDWQLHSLRLVGGGAQVSLSKVGQRLAFSVGQFPLEIGMALADLQTPVKGYLSLLWEVSEAGPRFALSADSLRYKDQLYPDIRIVGEPEGDSIPFQVSLQKGQSVFAKAQGFYRIGDTVSPLFLELRSLQVPIRWLEPFLGEYIQNPKGTLQAQRLTIRGKPEAPLLFGEVFCNNVSFYMPLTRVVYTVEGVLRLRGDSVLFPNVEIRDARSKRSYLNGFIALRGWTSPYLQLTAQVQDKTFLLAASSATADAYLYGRAELERGIVSIVGPWDQPTIRGEVLFANSTDLTLPLRIYERSMGAAHVSFVKAADTTAPAPQVLAPAGLDVQVAIRSVPEARFRLLFDERTGDEISAQGTANLLFSISRTGQTSLSGSYEVQSGEYQVNLQGIASKKLFLEPGSRISWDGDLYQGQMNITATYKTYTSLRMIDTSFTYTLPVEVRVLLRGTLLSPLMSFQVEVPSLSGTTTPLINLFLQRLATDEQERNRQVFALLVLGTFVPLEQGFGTQQVSSGVGATLAEFLSAQLASWVGYTLGSQIGVSFALGEWNELSARLRLSLGQRFSIERDGVLVGPGQNSPALGNLSARYRILPRRLSQPTQWQLEVEGFSRQTFMWGAAGTTSQGAGIRVRKSFYPPECRQRKTIMSDPSEE